MEQQHAEIVIGHVVVSGDLKHNTQVIALRHVADKPLQRCRQPLILQHRGAEFDRQRTCSQDGVADKALERRKVLAHTFVGCSI